MWVFRIESNRYICASNLRNENKFWINTNNCVIQNENIIDKTNSGYFKFNPFEGWIVFTNNSSCELELMLSPDESNSLHEKFLQLLMEDD